MKNLEQLKEIAKNLNFTEKELSSLGVMLVVVERAPEGAEEHETHLTCVVQGSTTALIKGLAKCMEQDKHLSKLFKHAVREAENPLQSLLDLIDKMQKLKDSSKNSDTENDI